MKEGYKRKITTARIITYRTVLGDMSQALLELVQLSKRGKVFRLWNLITSKIGKITISTTG